MPRGLADGASGGKLCRIDAHAPDPLDQPMEPIEEQIAHLTRIVDDLSEVVARQERELALMMRRVQLLLEREATREVDQGGSVPLGDERPPHY